jgi:hypothetical protein
VSGLPVEVSIENEVEKNGGAAAVRPENPGCGAAAAEPGPPLIESSSVSGDAPGGVLAILISASSMLVSRHFMPASPNPNSRLTALSIVCQNKVKVEV